MDCQNRKGMEEGTKRERERERERERVREREKEKERESEYSRGILTRVSAGLDPLLIILQGNVLSRESFK